MSLPDVGAESYPPRRRDDDAMSLLFKVISRGTVLLLILHWAPNVKELALSPITLTQGVASSVELQNLQKTIVMVKNQNGAYPEESEFESIVLDKFSSVIKDPRLDYWGRPYRYRRRPGGFEIRTGGPDRKFETNDDLTMKWEDA